MRYVYNITHCRAKQYIIYSETRFVFSRANAQFCYCRVRKTTKRGTMLTRPSNQSFPELIDPNIISIWRDNIVPVGLSCHKHTCKNVRDNTTTIEHGISRIPFYIIELRRYLQYARWWSEYFTLLLRPIRVRLNSFRVWTFIRNCQSERRTRN